jgi:2-oxoglutarate dehydrogenase E2 component (dihydrolipoamide succinyltransferase)
MAIVPAEKRWSMLIDVILPQLGESVAEGTVSKWLVSEGDIVHKDQAIVSVATDKADAEVPAPVGGRLVEILAAEGATLAVRATLARIDDSNVVAAAEALEGAEGEASGSSEERILPANEPNQASETDELGAHARAQAFEGGTLLPGALATPTVRKTALEHDVNLAQVRGTGQRGRVTRDDVLRAARGAGLGASGADELSPTELDSRSPIPSPADLEAARAMPSGDAGGGDARGPAPRSAPPVHASGIAAPIPGVGFGAFRVAEYKPAPGDEVVPLSRRRRITADHMVYSKTVSPHVVAVAEVDLKRATTLRDLHKARYKSEGMNLTVLAFVVIATARALREHPAMNARMLEDAYVLLRDVHIGVAVDSPEGLVVPVVRHADELGVRGVVRAIDDLATRAKAGKITLDELGGATFSVSNPGLKGNMFGGAIINQPNVGILRMGEIQKRVVVVEATDGDDQMAIHPVMHLALSYDHRVVDGVAANGFLWRVTELLERADFEP